jgi:hypothetical protein
MDKKGLVSCKEYTTMDETSKKSGSFSEQLFSRFQATACCGKVGA